MIVVDTNILAYHWLPGVRGAETSALLRVDAEWAAPVLWRSELCNVLAGYLRKGSLDLRDARRTMKNAEECLRGGEHFVSDESVLELIAGSGCSAYDCEFVALAMALETRLVTEDRALCRAFPRCCRSLKEMVPEEGKSDGAAER